MSVIGKLEIKRRLELPPDYLKALVVTPLDKGAIDTDSIDLRLGSHFLVPYPYRKPFLKFKGKQDVAAFQQLIHVPRGDEIVVPPHSTILGSVHEYIKLPFDVAAQVLTKSSLARLFIAIEGAPWVHPLYRGCLTLEIANTSGTAVTVQPHDRVAQLVFFDVDRVKRPLKDQIEGTYIGPIGPEIAGF